MMGAILKAVSAIIVLSTAANAQEQFTLFPQIFEITGVADDDALNVREASNADAYILGSLLNGQQAEVTAYDASEKWARILWGGEDGWVARRFLAIVEVYGDDQSGMPVDLDCSGTEPFWHADITRDGRLVFAEMGGHETEEPIEYSVMSSNMYRTNYAFETATFTGFVRRAECSDGMSDQTYGWALDLMEKAGLNPVLWSGCCSTDLPVLNGN